MKRHILTIVATCYAIVSMSGMRVSPEDAVEAATSYYQLVRQIPPKECNIGTPELFSLLGKADMWLVPVNDSWIIVSTDKRVDAILAQFSTSERPDFRDAPPAVKCLLGSYENNIAYMNNSCQNCSIQNSWLKSAQEEKIQAQQSKSYPSQVPPLINSTWKQYKNASTNSSCNKVYNMLCPEISTTNPDLCNRAVVGCVAIAVGQIMRYWNWPYAADVPITVGGSTKSKQFYNWNLMPISLYNGTSQAEADQTATFLRDLGYDLDMNYGESSGAMDEDALKTFKHFGYDSNTITLRHKNNTEGWTNYLHSEIGAGRPVYYGGYDSFWGTGGHAFILDGYNSQGLYHINFGWGGNWDGFFQIDTFKIGQFDGYTYWQSAIWGIQPAMKYCTALTVNTPVETPKFCIAQASEVTISGLDINNNTEGRIYSEEGIRLTTGTNIRNGCNVHIAIMPIPCTPPISPSYLSANHAINQEHERSSVWQNRVVNYDNTHSDFLATNQTQTLFIYSMDGKLMFKGNSIALSTASLYDGVYILRSISEDGVMHQSKILLRR